MEKQPESRKKSRQSKAKRSRSDKLRRRYRKLEAFDRELVADGRCLAGIDEVGRGALAGPVVAAAVILPPDSGLLGVNDSKQLTESDREASFERIISSSLSVGIALSSPSVVDRENVLNASLMAMAQTIRNLTIAPDIVLIDGRDRIEIPMQVVTVVGGDRKSLSIAAASIVAKVTRDRLMRKLHQKYPVYNFLENKGYGTKEHLEAIDKHGVIDEHRRTFCAKAVEKIPQLF